MRTHAPLDPTTMQREATPPSHEDAIAVGAPAASPVPSIAASGPVDAAQAMRFAPRLADIPDGAPDAPAAGARAASVVQRTALGGLTMIGRRLGHDAGQQAQPPVQAMAQPNGVGLDEVEASGAGAGQIVQLRIEQYPTNAADDVKAEYDAQVEAAEDRINDEVQDARAHALRWGDYTDSDNARLSLWAATAKQYFDDPATVPEFLHARFGYAIEELASENIPDPLQGLTVNLQVAAGPTRPDIVLNDGGLQVAWLDITAEESEGHILGKGGSGWKTRPFVAEILYDSLELGEILEGMNHPLLEEVGNYNAEKNQVKHEEVERERTNLRNALIGLQDANDFQTGYGNAATKKGQTRDLLTARGMNLGHQPNLAAKGALLYSDINPGPFGYGDGHSSIAAARAHVTTKAKAQIDARVGDINTDRLDGIRDRLGAVGASTAKTNYLQAAQAAQDNGDDLSDLIPRGIALAHALEAGEEAAQTASGLEVDHAGDPRTAAVVGAINGKLAALPADPSYADLRAWYDELHNLTYDAELLMDLIAKEDDFEQYLNQYYDDYQNDMTGEEAAILAGLRAPPTDYAPIEAADHYMADNPL